MFLIDYLHWQFVITPGWMINLLWNLERAGLRFFSIGIMFRTLLSYWHKDAMAFTGGSLGKLATIVMWNTISRLIGFIIRTLVIISWLAVQSVFLPIALMVLVVVVLWPILVLVGVASGLAFLVIS